MLALVPFRDLTKHAFPELCHANVVVRHGGLIAITSIFPLLAWPARGVHDGRRYLHRVALYTAEHRLVGVFDDARFHINDIAFHPTEPVLAIATGSYDGGYSYEGELWRWNWETGEAASLLDDSREIVRCRFEPDHRLVVLANPPNDMWGDTEYFTAAFDVRGPCLTSALTRCTPVDAGFDNDLDARATELARVRADLAIEPRAVIWDLAWTLDGRLAAARSDGQVELWSTATGTLDHLVKVGGNVVQLLRQPTRLLVHAIQNHTSRLFALADNSIELWHELPGTHGCSVDASGRLLARRTTRESRRDRLITASNKILVDADLGHYDPFNHFLRIDGAPELFLLRGTPTTDHVRKQLCTIEPGALVAHAELAWDVEGEHRMTSSAVLFEDDLVCCYRVHQSSGGGPIRIERRTRQGGATVWRHPIPAAAIALVAWPAVGGVVAALIDGTLHIVAGNGEVLLDEQFALDGTPTIPTALAVHGETLVIGTIDGRVAMRSLR